MTIRSILRINHQGMPQCLYRYDVQNKKCELNELNQWTDQALVRVSQEANADLTVLVPASWVYHSQTQVASKNTELLTKSIPYAIEEELSNDVEDNYYAFKINDDGTQSVIAIEKTYIIQLNEALESHGIEVETINSEVDWLPVAENSISIWSDSKTALFKMDANQAMRIAPSQINQLLPVFAQDKQQVICNDKSIIDYSELPIEQRLTAADCCAYLSNHEPINLYVDEIKAKQNEQSIDSWQTVKILVGVLALSWFVIQGIQWYGLNQSIAEIKQQQVNLFKQSYPNAVPSELVDPFAAIQSRLKKQNSQTTQDQSMLIAAVDNLGQTLSKQQSVILNGLRMIDQKMELQIAAPNMTAINDFHQLLQQHANDFSVQIGVNELGDDNTFKSILTMVPR